MNYVEKYVDFLEGKLSDNEMHQFANQFANSDTFRDSFRQYLHLTKSLNESSKYFTPSNQVKSAVFSQLGLNPNAGAPITTHKLFRAPFMNSKLFAVVSSCILTFMVTYFTMINTQNDVYAHTDFASSSSIMKYHQDLLASNDKPVFTKQVGQSKELNKTFNSIVEKDLNKFAKNIIKSNSNKQVLDNNIQTDDEDINANEQQINPSDFENSNLSSNLMIENSSDRFEIPKTNFKEFDTIFFIRSYDSKLRFEFKNTPSWYSDNATVQPYQISKFNNLEVSMYMPIYKGLMIGANFRQETFFVEYDGINSKGQFAKILQQPNLTTYSLMLRYSPFDVSGKLKPFAQASLGTNIYGPVIREMAGVEFYPFENVYFVIGGEFNQLLFKHDEQWYNAGKFSINYGLGIKF